MHGSICFTQERMTERRQSGNFTTHNTNKGYQLVVFFVELYGYFGKKTIEKTREISPWCIDGEFLQIPCRDQRHMMEEVDFFGMSHFASTHGMKIALKRTTIWGIFESHLDSKYRSPASLRFWSTGITHTHTHFLSHQPSVALLKALKGRRWTPCHTK